LRNQKPRKMPIAKKTTTSETTLKIGNIEIELGKKYVLDHKFDGIATDGLKKIEATRLPFDKNTVVDCISFDEETQLYDTGFQRNSLCLSEYSEAELDELVPLYIKHVKTPFEKVKNVDLASTETSQFYKNYRYELYVNKEFDTAKPIQLFDLFNAINQGFVCAKGERVPFYNSRAQFTISNPSELKNKQKEKTKKRFTTIEKFSLMCENRDKLDLVLEYIGRDNPAKIDSGDLKAIYFEIITDKDKGLDFVDRFLEASDKYESEAGKMEMEYFAAAKRLHKANKIKKEKRGFMSTTGEVFLGNTFQDIAKFCLNVNSEQHRVVNELMEEMD